MTFSRWILHIAAALAFILTSAPLSPASAQTETVRDIAIAVAGGTIRLPRIEVEGGSLAAAEVQALFDGSQLASLSERLAKFDARAIRIPEVTFEMRLPDQSMPQAKEQPKQPPMSFTFSYRDLAIVDIRGGKAKSATLAGGTGRIEGPETATIDVERGSFTDLDLAAIAQFYAAKADPADMQPRLLYGEIRFEGMKVGLAKDGEFTIGRMASRDVRGRPLKNGFAALSRHEMALGQGGPGGKPDPAEIGKVMAIIADMYAAFEIGRTEVADLRFKARDPKGRPIRVGIARMAMEGYVKQRFGEAAIEGFTVEADDGFFKMGRLVVKPIDLTSTLAALAEVGTRPMEKWLTEGNNARRLLPDIGGYGLSDLTFDLPDDKRPGGRIKGRLGAFDIDMSRHILGVPTAIAFRMDKLAITLPDDQSDEGLRNLLDMGYRDIDISASVGLRWDEASRTIRLTDTGMSGVGMGQIRIEATIANVQRQVFTAPPAMVAVMLMAATGQDASVRVVNGGLVEKLADALARKDGKSPGEVLRGASDSAAMYLQMALGGSPVVPELTSAITAFLAAPRTLTVLLKSRKPSGISAADIMGAMGRPAAALDLIDITARANGD